MVFILEFLFSSQAIPKIKRKEEFSSSLLSNINSKITS